MSTVTSTSESERKSETTQECVGMYALGIALHSREKDRETIEDLDDSEEV